jgi:hypothetical protein
LSLHASYITAETLVSAALRGLDTGEAITTPTLADDDACTSLENARTGFLGVTIAGQLADRYLGGPD